MAAQADDDIPLSKLKASKNVDNEDDMPLSKLKKSIKKEATDDDDVPLSKLKRTSEDSSKTKSKVPVKEEKDIKETNKRKAMESTPKNTPKPDTKEKAKKVKREKYVDSDDSDHQEEKKKKSSVKKEKGKDSVKKEKKVKEETEVWEWWKDEKPLPAGKKWRTLSHNGVLFPEDYKPHNIKMLYDGKPVELSESAEEAATFYAKYLEADHVKHPKFRENFWGDFRKLLTKEQRKAMTDFEKCDFRHIHAHLVAEREQKKEDKERKQKEKEEKQKLADFYGKAVIDGHEVKISNYLIEPPGLFLGRGDHPKRGTIKKRVTPEEVTINIGKEATAPKAPAGHKWKEVIHDDSVAWIASWKENVSGQPKYVKLHASSHISGKSDMKKYELSRKLKNKIDKIRKAYMTDMSSDQAEERQRAVAIYFIDTLALRVGNEKGEDEADTVGCCSLRVEHIQLLGNNKVALNFLGKDSMEYKNEFEVKPAVFKALEGFVYKKLKTKERKKDSESLFDKLTTTTLNKYLKGQVEGLSAKVFRTYNASITLEKELAKMPESLKSASVAEKIAFYNAANRAVAILCNHKKTVSKSFGESMAKIDVKIDGFEKQKKKLQQQLKYLRGKGPKPEDDSDEEEPATPKKKSSDKKRKADAEDDFEESPKKKKKTLPDDPDKVKKAIEKVEQSILKWNLQKQDREGNKEVALGTAKINYMDPRITAAWCKKVDLPVEKIFNKSLMAKFPWAMDPGEDWKY